MSSPPLFDPGSRGYYLRCAAVILAVAVILSIPFRNEPRLVQELENSGHALLFGIASLVLLRNRQAGLDVYLGTFFLTVAFGAATEGMQWIEGRGADLLDIVRDGAGAAAFLGFTWTITRPGTRFRKILIRLCSIALMLIVFWPPIWTSAALVHRWRTFPELVDFGSKLGTRFCSEGKSRLEVVTAPWQPDAHAARVTFMPAEYSGWHISGPWPDWAGYHELSLVVFSELSETVVLNLRIHDSLHNNSHGDRFNTQIAIHPGLNPVTIPLEKIISAPKGRRMNPGKITGTGFFVMRPSRSIPLYFGNIRLRS